METEVRYWENPNYWTREVRADWCPRCQEPHNPEAHFDRCQWDCAAVAELSALALLHQLPGEVVNETYTVQEVAAKMGFSVQTVTRIF